MTGSFPQGTRWELVSQDDGSEAWTWRQMGIDDAILQASETHSTFGKAIHDALTHGFGPAVDHWVIKSGGWVTHFAPGAPPITTGPDDQVLQRPASATDTDSGAAAKNPSEDQERPH